MDIQSMDKPSILLQLKRITEQNLPIKGTYVKTLKQEDIFDSPVNKTTELHAVKVGNQQILVPIVKEEELTQGAISDDLVMKLLSKIKDKKSREVLSAYIEQEQEQEQEIKKPIIIAKEKTEKEGEETDETVLLKERKDEILKTVRQFKTVKELSDYLETEKIDEFKKELKDNKLTVTLSALTRSINAIRKRLETTGYIQMKKAEEEEAKTKAKQEEEEKKRKAKEEEAEVKRKAKEEEAEVKRKAKQEEMEKKRKAKEQEEKEIQEALKFIEGKEEQPKDKKKKKKQKSKKGVSEMTKEEVASEIKMEKTKVMTKKEVEDEIKKEKTKVMTKKEVEEELEKATKKEEPKAEAKPTMTELQVKELKDAFIKNIKTIVKEKKIRNTKILKALLKEKGYEKLKEELIGAGFKSSATGLVKSINAIINSMAN